MNNPPSPTTVAVYDNETYAHRRAEMVRKVFQTQAAIVPQSQRFALVVPVERAEVIRQELFPQRGGVA